MTRRRRNRILALKDEVSDWIHDGAIRKAMVRDFFISLYSKEHVACLFLVTGGFTSVNSRCCDFMFNPVTKKDIRQTLFSMGGLKAPGLDGLHALFFQSQWEVVGGSLCELVFKFLHDPTSVKDINQTYISLIPKIDHPELVKHFCPISLCNVAYKLLTKILANKLKPMMPSIIAFAPTQCGFVRGRSISNNIIVAQ